MYNQHMCNKDMEIFNGVFQKMNRKYEIYKIESILLTSRT